MSYDSLPRPNSVTRERIINAFLDALPPGNFAKTPGSNWYKIAEWVANFFMPIAVGELQTIQDELDPSKATTNNGLLENWERFVLDPRCHITTGLTDTQRAALVVAAIKRNNTGLTLSELHQRVVAAFPTEVFNQTTETTPLVVGCLKTNNLKLSGTIPAPVVKPSNSITDDVLEVLRCFVASILPISVRSYTVKGAT